MVRLFCLIIAVYVTSYLVLHISARSVLGYKYTLGQQVFDITASGVIRYFGLFGIVLYSKLSIISVKVDIQHISLACRKCHIGMVLPKECLADNQRQCIF